MAQGIKITSDRMEEIKSKILSYMGSVPHATFGAACASVGIARSTAYLWRQEDKAFDGSVKLAYQRHCDGAMIETARSKLMRRINEGDLRAIIYFLDRYGQDRGFGRRRNIQKKDHASVKSLENIHYAVEFSGVWDVPTP